MDNHINRFGLPARLLSVEFVARWDPGYWLSPWYSHQWFISGLTVYVADWRP